MPACGLNLPAVYILRGSRRIFKCISVVEYILYIVCIFRNIENMLPSHSGTLMDSLKIWDFAKLSVWSPYTDEYMRKSFTLVNRTTSLRIQKSVYQRDEFF